MDLYAIRVVKKEQAKVQLKVYQVYEDGEDRAPMPVPRFFLSVIAQEVGPMNKRLNLLPPLAQEILKHKPSRNASEHEAIEHFTGKLMRLRPQAYLATVEVLEENHPASKPKGIFHWKYSTKAKAFKDDEAKITWALFEVTMTDPNWIDHLEEGDLFGTADYFD